MFDLPDAKRVRRADLNSGTQSPELCSPDPIFEEQVQTQLARIYNGHLEQSNTGDVEESRLHATEINDDKEEYEFRLFAKPTISSGVSQSKSNRIVLRSPTPPTNTPGFITARRPDRCYFTGERSEELREQYRQAAISGDQLARGLDIRWPGCELPWRVTSVKAVDAKKATAVSITINESSARRKRAGKKRRIMIRRKTAGKVEKERIAKMNQQEKEAAEKEKRTRRNREKKVKKRQKEKMKRTINVEGQG